MALGPGKYDPACTVVMQETKADAVLLIVINGQLGSGFSIQCIPEWAFRIPELLRSVADDMERSTTGKAS